MAGGSPVPPVTAQHRLEHIVVPSTQGDKCVPGPMPHYAGGIPEHSVARGVCCSQGRRTQGAARTDSQRVRASGSCQGPLTGVSVLLCSFGLSHPVSPSLPARPPQPRGVMLGSGSAGTGWAEGTGFPGWGRGLGGDGVSPALIFVVILIFFPFTLLLPQHDLGQIISPPFEIYGPLPEMICSIYENRHRAVITF